MTSAWKQVEEWLDCERGWVPEPTERHRETLGSLLAGSGMQANLVPDANPASLAIDPHSKDYAGALCHVTSRGDAMKESGRRQIEDIAQ